MIKEVYSCYTKLDEEMFEILVKYARPVPILGPLKDFINNDLFENCSEICKINAYSWSP